ncbi:HAMP domain-containing histidine kinase [archaeon]|nr:HAMP domain-containing histidine kinase [archaeon]
MKVLRLPEGLRLVDFASAIVIGSLGLFINTMYFTLEYLKSSGDVLAQTWARPVEHALVISTVPLYLAVGYIYWSQKRVATELQLANKDLERSKNLKELFADILRHDLTTPLTILSGFVDLIPEEKLEEDVKENFKEIEMGIERMTSLIEKASVLSKIEHKTDLEREGLDLVQCINDVLWMYWTLANMKNIEVEFENKEPTFVQANMVIEEVFGNLFSNAIKYSPENTKIVVDIKKFKERCRVYFKDQGEGIKDSDKEAIFTRFERRQKGPVKGIGLGLTIAKKIVELHEGRIWVEDNPSGGSIFIVELPINGDLPVREE